MCSISSNETEFKAAALPHQEALAASGFDHNLKYEPTAVDGSRKRNRGRQISYFNPTYSANVDSKIGAKFLRLIDTCFPHGHPLRKIINRNTVKVAYRTMPNMKQIPSMHNSKVRYQEVQQPPPG